MLKFKKPDIEAGWQLRYSLFSLCLFLLSLLSLAQHSIGSFNHSQCLILASNKVKLGQVAYPKLNHSSAFCDVGTRHSILKHRCRKVEVGLSCCQCKF